MGLGFRTLKWMLVVCWNIVEQSAGVVMIESERVRVARTVFREASGGWVVGIALGRVLHACKLLTVPRKNFARFLNLLPDFEERVKVRAQSGNVRLVCESGDGIGRSGSEK